jgi:hypothetical protein
MSPARRSGHRLGGAGRPPTGIPRSLSDGALVRLLCQGLIESPAARYISSGLVTLGSAESAAPVHRRLGSPRRVARLFFSFCGAESTDRADAVAIQSAIAAPPAEPRCGRIVDKPACPHTSHTCTLGSPSARPGSGDWVSTSVVMSSDLTPAALPPATLISWRCTSTRCARTRTTSNYAATRRLSLAGGSVRSQYVPGSLGDGPCWPQVRVSSPGGCCG